MQMMYCTTNANRWSPIQPATVKNMHACCIIGSVSGVRCFRLSWLVLSAMRSPNHELSGHVSILTAYSDPSHLNFIIMVWLCFEQSPHNLFDTTLASGTLSDIYSSTDAVVILSGIPSKFYLTYILTLHLELNIAFYLVYILTFYLKYILMVYLAFYLT